MNKSIDIARVLVNRIRQRDQTALDYLYDHYGAALFGVIKRTVRHQELAEETFQDVMLKIWDQIDQYDESKGTFFTWMYRMARNKSIDMTRSKDFKTIQQSTEATELVSMFDHDEHDSLDYVGLKDVIKKLGDMCKTLIAKNFFMGYSHSEISEQENLPLGTIKTRFRGCLQKLKNELKFEIG